MAVTCMYIPSATLDDLMRRVLGKLVKSNVRNRASRGDTRELRSVLLKLSNPRARLSHTEKKGKIFSALGELLWYLAKSNDLEFISYYLDQYRKESEDGATVYGAYGPRLFNKRGNDQVRNVISLLGRNPSTRRAVIQLFDAEDIAAPHMEIPCTCTLQFMIRDGRLELVACMRSNDAFKGLPHDVFSFTMIQEIIARTLGCQLGNYTHFVGSLHLYDRDLRAAKQYLVEGWQPTQFVAMPTMPPGDPRPSVETLLVAEAAIRRGRSLEDSVEQLSPYWRDLIRLLEIYGLWKRKEGAKIPKIKGSMANPVYKEYITRREPPRRTIPRSGQAELPFAESPKDEDNDEER
jgi:thymidylate synthase